MPASAARTSASIALSCGLRANAICSSSSESKLVVVVSNRAGTGGSGWFFVMPSAALNDASIGCRESSRLAMSVWTRSRSIWARSTSCKRRLADFILRPRDAFQVVQQRKRFAVDAQLFVEEIKLVVSLLQIERGLQRGAFKGEIFGPAFGAGDGGARPQFAGTGKFLHKTGHHRFHDVRDVRLKRDLRVRQRALHRDVFDGRRPILVSGLHARRVEQRVTRGNCSSSNPASTAGNAGRWLAGPELAGDGLQVLPRLFFARRGDAPAAGEHQCPRRPHSK